MSAFHGRQGGHAGERPVVLRSEGQRGPAADHVRPPEEIPEEFRGGHGVGECRVGIAVDGTDGRETLGEFLRRTGQHGLGGAHRAHGPVPRVVEINAAGREFADQEFRVEGGVVGDDDTAVDERRELRGDLGEAGCIRDVGGPDPVDGGVVEMPVRLDEGLPGALQAPVGVGEGESDLQHPVRGEETGGLEIDDGEAGTDHGSAPNAVDCSGNGASLSAVPDTGTERSAQTYDEHRTITP